MTLFVHTNVFPRIKKHSFAIIYYEEGTAARYNKYSQTPTNLKRNKPVTNYVPIGATKP